MRAVAREEVLDRTKARRQREVECCHMDGTVRVWTMIEAGRSIRVLVPARYLVLPDFSSEQVRPALTS